MSEPEDFPSCQKHTEANDYECVVCDRDAWKTRLEEAEKIRHDNRLYCPCANEFQARAVAAEERNTHLSAQLDEARAMYRGMKVKRDALLPTERKI